MVTQPNTALPHVKSGRVRAIATTGGKRSPVYPDVETLVEAGFSKLDITGYYCVVGPAGLPRPILDRLNAEIRRAVGSPDVRDAVMHRFHTPYLRVYGSDDVVGVECGGALKNVIAIATGLEEHNEYGAAYIEATRIIKQTCPGAKVSGGVSNLSFAFRGNDTVREAIHSAIAMLRANAFQAFDQLVDVLRLGILRILRAGTCPQRTLDARPLHFEIFPAPARKRFLIFIVSELCVRNRCLAFQRIIGELRIDLGINTRDKERGDGGNMVNGMSCSDMIFQSAEVGIHHLGVTRQ